MAGAEGGVSRHRAASDRTAAIQQGQGGRSRLFDVIETVGPRKDRQGTGQRDGQAGPPPPLLYVQVNTGLEEQKAGIDPDRGRSPSSNAVRNEHGLEIGGGLMCIPPFDEKSPDRISPLLRQARPPEAGVEKLSMGMSGDLRVGDRLRSDLGACRLSHIRRKVKSRRDVRQASPAAVDR